MRAAEVELEAELEGLTTGLANSDLKSEAEIFGLPLPATQPLARPDTSSAILAFNVPELPFSPERFKWIEKSLDVYDAVHTAFDVFGPELLGLVPGIFAATGPLAVFFSFWLGIGGAYLEAQAAHARVALRRGFRLGVVTGADYPRRWSFVKELFWQQEPNYQLDVYAGKGAARLEQQAFNGGLAAGYVQGRNVAKSAKKLDFFWKSIKSKLSDLDLQDFRDSDRTRWSRRMWSDWYSLLAVRFDQLYLKD